MEGRPSPCRHRDRVTVPDHILYSATFVHQRRQFGPHTAKRATAIRLTHPQFDISAHHPLMSVRLALNRRGETCWTLCRRNQPHAHATH
jgi:hypothetical protein